MPFSKSSNSSGSNNVGVSRIGEWFFGSSNLLVTRADVIAVNPGRIINGAVTHVQWSALHPEFIDGDDILFPANVEGMFLRNIGGEAAVEGVFQQDQLQGHRHRLERLEGFTTSDANNTNIATGTGDTGQRYFTDNSYSNDGINGNPRVGTETRSKNRGYQLYTIVS